MARQTSLAVNVSGMKELHEQLKRLPRRMGRAALERAGIEAAEPTARLMRQLAPKDTEELSESIDVGTKATDYDYGAKAYAKVLKRGGTRDEALGALIETRRANKGTRGETYATVFIGPVAGRTRDETIKGFVMEFGTATREPHPFMRTAFDQERGPLMTRLKNGIAFEVFASVEKAGRLGRLRG